MAPARECGRTIAHKREPQKAEVFRWSLPPHPAADSFIHGLRTVMYLRISGLASYDFFRQTNRLAAATGGTAGQGCSPHLQTCGWRWTPK